MWAPRWLRTLARRKSAEEANAESARQLNNFFAPGGIVAHRDSGSDEVPIALRESARLIGDAYVRVHVDQADFRAKVAAQIRKALQEVRPLAVDEAVDELMGMLKPPLRSEVLAIVRRVYAAGIANREEGSQ